MIAGATRGRGGAALGRHLADAKAHNEETRLGSSRGLVGDTIRERVDELTDIAGHARSAQPLYHVHADPPPDHAFDEAAWGCYWERFEREFGLQAQPYAEAIHVKEGREHRHRVYSRVQADGTCIRLDNDYQRIEKLSRITEVREHQPITTGKHNRAVIAALEAEQGNEWIAAALKIKMVDYSHRPVADTSPTERAQQERTKVGKMDVQAAIWEAWKASDSGQALEAALAGRGLRLAVGDRGAVVVDGAGGAHSLSRLVGAASKQDGERVGAAVVRDRIAGLSIPGLDEARAAIRDAGPAQGRGDDNSRSVTEPANTPEIEKTQVAKMTITALEFKAAEEAVRASNTAPKTAETQGVNNTSVKNLHAPAKGGNGAAPTSPAPRGYIAPIDNSRPGDAARFLRECGAELDRIAQANAAAAQAATLKGAPHGLTPEDIYALARRIVEAWRGQGADERTVKRSVVALGRYAEGRVAGAEAAAMGVVGHKTDPRRDIDGRPIGTRQEGVASVVNSGPNRGGDRRPANAIAGVAGAARGRGGEPDRQATRPSRGGGHGADPRRVQAGRARVAGRRLARGLAEEIGRRGTRMEALRDALSTPGERALRRLVAAEQAMAGQKGAPYPDPADRDPDVVGERYRQRVRDAVAALRHRREEAVAKVGFVDRLLAVVGIETTVVCTANAAIEAYNGALETRDFDLNLAWYAGRDEADRRHDALLGWEHQRKTRWRELAIVREAVESGRTDVVEAVADGRLDEVRVRLRVEAEERQRQAEANATSRWRPAVAPTPTPTVAPEPYAGPRFR